MCPKEQPSSPEPPPASVRLSDIDGVISFLCSKNSSFVTGQTIAADGGYVRYLHVALFGAPIDYHALLKARFKGTYLMGGGLDQTSAEVALDVGRADATVFGAAFLANPDLPVRFAKDAPLNTPDKATFYGGDAKGYIDYPELEATQAA